MRVINGRQPPDNLRYGTVRPTSSNHVVSTARTPPNDKALDEQGVSEPRRNRYPLWTAHSVQRGSRRAGSGVGLKALRSDPGDRQDDVGIGHDGRRVTPMAVRRVPSLRANNVRLEPGAAAGIMLNSSKR